MSFKRIAAIGAGAVGALALVGGGYAAAQSNGPSTTLITNSAAGTTSQAYGGATTSQLSQPGIQMIATGYANGCPAEVSGTTITVTVTGTQGTPTGSVTFNGHGNSRNVGLNGNGEAITTYPNGAKGNTISYNYVGTGTYSGSTCSGSIQIPKLTQHWSAGSTVRITPSRVLRSLSDQVVALVEGAETTVVRRAWWVEAQKVSRF